WIYGIDGQFSLKLDVFSFGVLVLEITWRNWREGTTLNIVDLSINNYSRNEMLRCIHIGLLCVQENLADKPTMATIILMLNSCYLSLPIPSEHAFHVNTLQEKYFLATNYRRC
ncbi:Cysteine-rich receptor-like protein kinase 29, partial [Mucuna pruriens]